MKMLILYRITFVVIFVVLAIHLLLTSETADGGVETIVYVDHYWECIQKEGNFITGIVTFTCESKWVGSSIREEESWWHKYNPWHDDDHETGTTTDTEINTTTVDSCSHCDS